MSRPHKWVELETPIVDLYTLKPKEFAFRNTAKLKTTQDRSTDAGKWAYKHSWYYLKRFKSSCLISRGSLLQKWLLESLLLHLIETFEFQELILLRLTFFLNVVCFFSFKCFSDVVYYATRAFINIIVHVDFEIVWDESCCKVFLVKWPKYRRYSHLLKWVVY